MIDQLARDRELLTMHFPESAVRLRPDVYCKPCKDKQCTRHQVAVCATCGEHVTTAHTHVPYLPHEHIRDLFDLIDPNWSCDPSAIDERGNPVLDQGCLWVRLTVAGKTVYGVGDGGGEAGAHYRQLAFTYALRHAAEQFGVGRYLRQRERERPPVEEPPPVEAVSAPKPQDKAVERASGGGDPEHLLARIVNRAGRNGLDPATLDANFIRWSTSVEQPDGVRLHQATAEQLSRYLELLGGKTS